MISFLENICHCSVFSNNQINLFTKCSQNGFQGGQSRQDLVLLENSMKVLVLHVHVTGNSLIAA